MKFSFKRTQQKSLTSAMLTLGYRTDGAEIPAAEHSFHLQTGNGDTPALGTPLTTLLSLVSSDRKMKCSCVRGSSDWLRKVLHCEGAGALKQLSWEVVVAPNLSGFKEHLEYALNNMVSF